MQDKLGQRRIKESFLAKRINRNIILQTGLWSQFSNLVNCLKLDSNFNVMVKIFSDRRKYNILMASVITETYRRMEVFLKEDCRK
jgi:hypothetical protein